MTYRIGRQDVSRETFEKLEVYGVLLKKWNPKINLVSKSTLDDLWDRHIVDSAQIWEVAECKSGHWVDIGSGGGFPGLVIAMIAQEQVPDLRVTLIESDQRKCAFLRTVARETETQCTVLAQRVEKVPAQQADVLSARALAALPVLLGFADQHLSPNGVAVFPKGATWKKEVEDARQSWSFSSHAHTSETESSSVILKLNEISHV